MQVIPSPKKWPFQLVPSNIKQKVENENKRKAEWCVASSGSLFAGSNPGYDIVAMEVELMNSLGGVTNCNWLWLESNLKTG